MHLAPFRYSHKYSNGESFKFSFTIISGQMLVSFLIATVVSNSQGKPNPIPPIWGFMSGLFNFGSVFFGLTSLEYLSYPFQALIKSSKILSVLLGTLILRNKTDKRQNIARQQIVSAVIITFGIIIFNLFVYFPSKCPNLLTAVAKLKKKHGHKNNWGRLGNFVIGF